MLQFMASYFAALQILGLTLGEEIITLDESSMQRETMSDQTKHNIL